jgi:hypothetical protein
LVYPKLETMNSKLALTAIAMIAAIMAFGVATPALAAPNENANDKAKVGKVSICHWDEGVLDDPETTDVDETEPAQWVVINVSGNAQKAHVDKHTDGTSFDALIDDSAEPAEGTITTEDCLARNTPAPEPEPEVIPEG